MKRTLGIALGVAAALAAQLAAAQVVFYSQEGFRGRSFSVNWATPNLDPYGFNDRASSAVVERGNWEVCDDANFHGRCIVLRPGQYPSLASLGMADRASSVRPARGAPSRGAVRPPQRRPAYNYYPRYGETLYTANVVAVRAVMGPPQQRCWVEQQYVPGHQQPNVPGAIIGGIIGGVLGHQIGNGRGNDVATALGAVGGAAVGANVNRPGYRQDVRRCSTVPGSGQPAYWDVTYDFRGRLYRAQLSYAPGPTITVNGKGEPRV